MAEFESHVPSSPAPQFSDPLPPISNNRYPAVLILILLLAFALRLFRLGADSLWYDETVSVFLAGKDVAGLLAHTARDIHPPGYYLLLHFWQGVAGHSDFAAAFLSLFFGVLLVALACRLAGRFWGPRAATIAALLVASSPYNVWYSQEVRMYTLGAVLAMGVAGMVLRYCRTEPSPAGWKGTTGTLAAYTILAALGLWTLYYFAFLLVAVNLFAVAWWVAARHRRGVGRRWLLQWTVAQAAALILYAPWVPGAWRQATDPPVPPWRSFMGAWDVLIQTWTALGLGQSADPAWAWPALVVLAGLVVLALMGRSSLPRRAVGLLSRRAAAWFLIGCVLAPVALIYLASFVTPLFHVRYVFTYSTPFYVVAAAGLAWLWRRRAATGIGALALIALFAGASLVAYYASPRYAADDHRAATAFLADAWRPGDTIVVNAGYAYPAILTYWPETGVEQVAWQGRLVGGDLSALEPCDGPALVMTGSVDGDPDLGWGDPASDFYTMTQTETQQALETLFATTHRVWLYRIYDTVTDPGGFIRDWLDEHGVLFTDRVFTGEAQLRVQGYLTGLTPAAGPCPLLPTQELVDGGSLVLTGLAPLASEVEVGGVLDLAAAWQVGARPPEDVYLFAGLFDEQGGRWAQVDEQPVGPLYTTGRWAARDTVRTPLRLRVPASTPPGEYRVELGWYRFEAGQPVWLPWRDGDRLLAGRVRVVPPAAGWASLPVPQPAYSAGVDLGAVSLLGFDAPTLDGQPGGELALDLYWQGGETQAQVAPAVLRLRDGEGDVIGEWASAPADGRAPFPALAAGQVVRDPRVLLLPATIEAGVYTLELGRRPTAGAWLAVRRGPISLGLVYPLATVHVWGREQVRVPPTPQQPRAAIFGPPIRFLGYDLDRASGLRLTLYWQPVAPMTTRFKIAVHLLGGDGPGDIRTQADFYPHLPTTSWLPGEYLADAVKLDLPGDLGQDGGRYTLWLAVYDEAGGARLPVYDEDGTWLGDGLVLDEILIED